MSSGDGDREEGCPPGRAAVDLSSRATGRVEARVRADRPAFGYFAVDAEVALGLGIRW